jgi:hypothetical protein
MPRPIRSIRSPAGHRRARPPHRQGGARELEGAEADQVDNRICFRGLALRCTIELARCASMAPQTRAAYGSHRGACYGDGRMFGNLGSAGSR